MFITTYCYIQQILQTDICNMHVKIDLHFPLVTYCYMQNPYVRILLSFKLGKVKLLVFIRKFSNYIIFFPLCNATQENTPQSSKNYFSSKCFRSNINKPTVFQIINKKYYRNIGILRFCGKFNNLPCLYIQSYLEIKKNELRA